MKRLVIVDHGRVADTLPMKRCKDCGGDFVLAKENFYWTPGKGWRSRCRLCDALNKQRRITQKIGRKNE